MIIKTEKPRWVSHLHKNVFLHGIYRLSHSIKVISVLGTFHALHATTISVQNLRNTKA